MTPIPGLVQLVDEVPELIRGAELRHRCEVAGDVVAPGTFERMLGNRHEFHMGVALPAAVLDQFVGQLQVGEPFAPRANVHLVDAHRLRMHGLLPAVPHPVIVTPDVLALVHDRGSVRGSLSEPRHGIGLEPPDTVGTKHLELVEAACAGPFDKQCPDPGAGHQLHVVPLAVPVVEVTDEPYGLCVRSPHRESGAEDRPTFGVFDGHLAGRPGGASTRCHDLRGSP